MPNQGFKLEKLGYIHPIHQICWENWVNTMLDRCWEKWDLYPWFSTFLIWSLVQNNSLKIPFSGHNYVLALIFCPSKSIIFHMILDFSYMVWKIQKSHDLANQLQPIFISSQVISSLLGTYYLPNQGFTLENWVIHPIYQI